MKSTLVLVALLAFALMSLGSAGCSKGSNANETVNSSLSLPVNGANFRLSLTDAPHPSLSHVIVNVDHVELLLEKSGEQGRLILGQNMGPLDLLKLRDGVHLPIKDLNLKENVVVKQFRLVLKDDGNWIQRISDQSVCALKTPSQQQTGLKLIMPNGGVEIEKDQIYSLIIDFDVDHSIVDNKNNCLLKPVLKVKTLAQVPQTPSDDSGNDNSNSNGDNSSDDGTPTSTVGDSSSGNSSSGDTSSTGSSDSSPGNTSSGDTSTSDGSGSSTSGSSDNGSGDGAPIVTEGNSTFFNP